MNTALVEFKMGIYFREIDNARNYNVQNLVIYKLLTNTVKIIP